MIITTFDASNNILHSKFSGNISFTELIEYFHQLGRNNIFPSSLYYFEDHTEAEYSFKASEVKKLARVLNICITRFEYIRVAIVQSKPKETAFSIMAIQNIKHNKVYALVFSTHEAAMEWLMLHKEPKDMQGKTHKKTLLSENRVHRN